MLRISITDASGPPWQPRLLIGVVTITVMIRRPVGAELLAQEVVASPNRFTVRRDDSART
jgi:hypothetical protein